MIPLLIILAAGTGMLLQGVYGVEVSGEYTMVMLGITAGYMLFQIWVMLTLDDRILNEEADPKGAGLFVILLVFALVARIYIALIITGYPTDIGCWTGWSYAAAGKGFFDIYQNASFIDYPPGYMYILHILGSIAKMTGLDFQGNVYNIMLKSPAIIADLATAFIIYRLCVKRLKPTMGLLLAFLFVVNPLVLMDSAAWGQIDSILTLAVIGYLLALYRNRIVRASVFFVIGLLIKPQMLFFGPILAVVFIKYIFESGWVKAARAFIISIFIGAAMVALVSFPFTGDMPWYWIFEKYIGTIGSYNYITLNSANLYGLLGLNWMPTETVKWGMKLGTWGLVGLSFSTVLYFVLGFINKNKSNIFMLTAMMMTGIYALALKMHERYIFPVIVILLLAYIFDNKNSILAMFGVLTAAIFINLGQVLAVIHIPPKDILFRLCSGLVVAVYVWMTVYCFISVIRSVHDSRVNLAEASDEANGFVPVEESGQPDSSE